MGKKQFKGKNRRGGNRPGQPPADENGWRSYPAIVKQNDKLQGYYDTLLQLPEEEKKQFWDAFIRELPNSFRFCGSKGHALAVKRLLQSRYIPGIVEIEHYDGRKVEPPVPVPWYPDDLAWWMTTPKNVIRKFPPFAAFQKFLVSETSVGNISRQEVVSMIPPMLMDLRPGMVVLDMCAAPGSKAAQLLEMIHTGEEARVKKVLRSFAKEDGLVMGSETKDEAEADLEADPSDAGRATGLLIANDSDYKRGHMLVHQLKRLSSPNLLVTCHDATQFPSIKLPSTDSKGSYLKFDRILADVPCSGDGTIRKNVNLWKDWQPGNALGLHTTQVRILVRALQMLKKGGRVVYSTCSMNPVENEAVVAAAIERCWGPSKVEIVDCSKELPHLKRAPGMKQWQIIDKSWRTWNSWEEVEEYTKNEGKGVAPGRVIQSMFPKTGDSDCVDLPLDRCMRVYPHMQDTGGFFITVLEKKAEFKAKNEKEPRGTQPAANGAPKETAAADVSEIVKVEDATMTEAAPTDDAQQNESASKEEDKTDSAPDTGAEAAPQGTKRPLETDGAEDQESKKPKTESAAETPVEAATEPAEDEVEPPTVHEQKSYTGKNSRGPIEEPFKYLDPSHPTIQNIKEFYHLSPRFPDNRYMVRNEMGEPAKAIYYTTALTRDILTENEGRGIRFVHGGVRMYMKQDAPSVEVCRWRIQSEGMPILQGYVGEQRIIRLRKKETFHKLLIEMFPRINGEHWKRFDEIGERLRDIGMGCCVLRIEPEDVDDPDFSETMALPLWKSIQSLNLMLPKEDRSAMLLRIYNDSSPLINIALNKQKMSQQQRDEAKAQEAKQALMEDDEAAGEPQATAEAAGEDETSTKAENEA